DYIRNHVWVQRMLYAALFTILFFLGVFTYLRFYTHHGQSFSVPDFNGLTVEESNQLADEHHLNIEIEDSIFKQNARPSTVVNQNPPSGFKVKKGRNIFLILNASKPPKKKVPDVIGVSLRQAQAILETHRFNVGKISYKEDIARNNVLTQKFKGEKIYKGKKLYIGSKIDLILGDGYKTKKITPPDVRGMKTDQARKEIILSSLNVGKKHYDNTINYERDTYNAVVWKQNPAHNKSNKIPQAATVDLWLTLDSTKIKSIN
ncbi:MAG: PASTA domain-containing protein, partial [Bacteroidota bacterium]